MCGIVGAVAQRNVTPVLLEGLRRLEYRGYDSAGIAVINETAQMDRMRVQGKVRELETSLTDQPICGTTGIAHTRWATHGKPSVENAHPHFSRDEIAIVHNGIIENHELLRTQLEQQGYVFQSETDTEVIANLIHHHKEQGLDLYDAVKTSVAQLQGAFALAVICKNEPGRMVLARQGSPLVIGIGSGEYFAASDIFALLPVTQQFIVLEEGDIADISTHAIRMHDRLGTRVERPVTVSELSAEASDKGGYRHYMLKEIHAQPVAIAETLEGRIDRDALLESAFGTDATALFDSIRSVHIVACGTSYHAGLVARNWLESLTDLPCAVDIASEYRYRNTVVRPDTLFISISQSGETLDTLEALRLARSKGYAATLAICNAPESSLTRESDLVFLTRAGKEIGVASTKAFTTQLVSLLMLAITLGRRNGLGPDREKQLLDNLKRLPGMINQVFELDGQIRQLAEEFVNKHHVLYLGRGTMLPVAMEGALKLKEISYIHAEAYAAGELKHGPLALVDEDMPVIAVAPNNDLIEKLKSNLQEVRARGGKLTVFADSSLVLESNDYFNLIHLPGIDELTAPVLYTVPLQIFAYHVAVLKGLDVDQPRNLAKSVTVE